MTQNKPVFDRPDGDYQPSPDQVSDAGYWEVRLKENWGLHGVGHISYGVHYNRWLYKVRGNIFNREMRKLRTDWGQSDVLDIGSGTGFWIDAWQELGARSVTGSDVTQIAIDNLQRSHPRSRFIRLDISGSLDSHSPEDRYDVVSAFDVLFHITSDTRFAAAITNVYRLISNGGYFIFTDNFVHGKEVRGDHQVSRPLSEISEVVANAGFKILRRVPVFVLMNAPVDTPGTWPSKLWRLAMLPVRTVPLLGSLYGSVLYPCEVLLTRFLRESPTTEMMICQKGPAV
jgi:SAM-dependent methyltransferase